MTPTLRPEGGKWLRAALLCGGASTGTRFRPLSLSAAKPLFPVAGLPMIYHHIQALAQVEGMREILLIGFYGAWTRRWPRDGSSGSQSRRSADRAPFQS